MYDSSHNQSVRFDMNLNDLDMTQGHRVMRKQELGNHSVVKWLEGGNHSVVKLLEGVKSCMTVDYGKEMAIKKSCKYGKYGLF